MGDGNRIVIVNNGTSADQDITITSMGTGNDIHIKTKGTVGTVTLPTSWDDDVNPPTDTKRNRVWINGVEQTSP